MICQDRPRVRFVHLPTPLEAAPLLSEALGVDLLIKREDLAGLCVGGNKARLLEFAIGALREKGVDTLIACAAEQSNKLRDIAAVAARLGMKAVLLIPGDPPTPGGAARQGNRLLFDILGAEVRLIPPGLDRGAIIAAQEAVRDACAATGRRAAILDRALGYGIDATIAYVDAAEELHRQLAGAAAPHAVFIAAGAGMTAAGLALGLKHLASPMRVMGVCIAGRAAELAPEIERHAARAAEALGIPTRLCAEDLTLIDDYAAIGYGVVTPPLVDVIRRFARLHGLVVDPVYNAKVALALVDGIAAGRIPRGASVVYINTGGSPAIYDYAETLAGGRQSEKVE